MILDTQPHHPSSDTLLIEIGVLRHRRQYSEILTLTDPIPYDRLLLTPFLIIARAGSLSQLRRHGEALAILLESEPAIRVAKDSWILASWQLLLAIQLVHAGRLSTATSLLSEAISSAAANGYPKILADAYNTLGVCLSFLGEVDQAILLFKRSMTSWQGIGDSRGVAFSNHNIGMVLREWGHPWRAEPYLQRADLYYTAEGIIEERVCILAERALLYCDLGDRRLAKRLARRSVDSTSGHLSTAVRALALKAVGIVACRFESIVEGESALLEALDVLGEECGGLLKGELLEELAVVALARDPPNAGIRLDEALVAYREIGSTRHCERLLARVNPDSLAPK